MSTLAMTRTLARQTSRLAYLSKTSPARRFLNTDNAPILYSVNATATGARNGHVEGSEDLDLRLGMPKALGGTGEKGKTNPEELFAAGYGACFQSAMELNAKALGIKLPEKPGECTINTTVHMVGNLKELDLGLRVDMLIKVRGVSAEDMDKLVTRTKETCPYSRATQGNVTTNVKVDASE